MFELLKKQVLSKLNVIEKTQLNSYPAEGLEIHNEFNTAADKLLEEANQILKESEQKDFQKADRLKALGFTKANQVAELEPIREKINLSKEQIELVNYYKVQYPFNKFITAEQVEQICKKYGLVYGDVSLYKGFVPEKNLKEIESFKLKDKESFKETRVFYNNQWRKSSEDDIQKYLRWRREDKIENIDQDKHWNSPDFKYEISNNKLLICAPIKDMDTTGMKLTKGFKLEKEIPDPVVLQPVNQGFLIVTMWADEQFDPFTEPLLRNDEINN